jgi:thioredoxin-dependent peroxiredoxin
MRRTLGVIVLVLAGLTVAGTRAAAQQPVPGQPELKVGDMAPDFTLQASDGKTYSLSKLRGKTVVLAWFPKAFTAGWTAECKALRESGQLIREFDVAYFMISVDTLEDNTAFAKKESADFPLLADPTKAVARQYGVLADFSRFKIGEVANRWTFYIGPDGRIIDIDRKVSPGTSGEDIVAHLKALKVPPAKK